MIATILSTAVTTILMGLYARYPFALALGMGSTPTSCHGSDEPWHHCRDSPRSRMISVSCSWSFAHRCQTGHRCYPYQIKRAIPVGIGLFIAVIGFKGSGLMQIIDGNLVLETSVNRPADVSGPDHYRPCDHLGPARPKGQGSIFLGITHCAGRYDSILARNRLRNPGSGFPPGVIGQASCSGSLMLRSKSRVLMVVFAFLFVDMFDTIGTLIGVADQGGFLNEKGELERIDRAMQVDAFGTC